MRVHHTCYIRPDAVVSCALVSFCFDSVTAHDLATVKQELSGGGLGGGRMNRYPRWGGGMEERMTRGGGDEETRGYLTRENMLVKKDPTTGGGGWSW